MIMVEQSQVWIGSQDSNIYIINTHSMSCNKQLNDHRSDVTDIVVDKKNGIPRYAQLQCFLLKYIYICRQM